MKKHITKKQWLLLSVLLFFIIGIKKYADYRWYESQSDLYKKSHRQIEFYESHLNLDIYISHEMCEYYEEKGMNCSWELNIPYRYYSSEYNKKRDQWFLYVYQNDIENTKRISAESVRIIEGAEEIFSKESWIYVDEEKIMENHPNTQFIANRAYYYVCLGEDCEEILILDYLGNQAYENKKIQIPTPPIVE
ncbi:MAG: hypothetical protein MRY57_02505 [Candidatus Pacebacteria bacterium]|nr:hypothetical protein [Candidatus Paceibacterota bacterium]